MHDLTILFKLAIHLFDVFTGAILKPEMIHYKLTLLVNNDLKIIRDIVI